LLELAARPSLRDRVIHLQTVAALRRFAAEATAPAGAAPGTVVRAGS
jgi:hypothetical protein